METQIVKALLNREAFDKYNASMKPDWFSNGKRSPAWKVYSFLKEYYAKYESEIKIDELCLLHKTRIQGLSVKEQEAILEVYADMLLDEDTTVVDELFKGFRDENYRIAAQEAILEGDTEKAKALLEELQQEEAEEEDLFSSLDIVEVVENSSGEGLECFMPALREYIPRLTFGTGALIVARSNAGKTSFLCPQALHVADGGGRVMHFALSEDGEEELLIRYIMAAYNCTEEYIRDNLVRARDKFLLDYGDQLRIFNTGTCHHAELEKRIAAFEPTFVIYDQYQKVMTSDAKNLSTPEQRTKAASVIKDLSIKHGHHYWCATQADKDAKWIVTDLNVDNAKTGVVGEFKTIIGLGKEDEDHLRNIGDHMALKRNINIAKNKGKMGMFTAHLVPDKCLWKV